ncbi:hypothetical protein ACFRJ9_05020 [Paenarthrobacter sp. NPDC056912]|uniref:hypothetical protein n=1 Tax=Paenarthrobacter sp. NPDC056912 TaxID=3345965 RepID=UPI00366D88DE
MHDDAGFYAPLQYQPHWLWIGLLLVLLVASWYMWILWPARRKANISRPGTLPDVEMLRATCLTALDATASDADAGRIPERAAHQRLSYLVREFAGAATGLPVTSMTLEELHGHGLEELAAGIAGIYPNEFAPIPVHSVRHSLDAARQAVLAWN